MIFSNQFLVRVALLILGVCGFIVAKHIRNHKTKNTPLVCPIGFDCHSVVHSDYSKFLGLPVEFLGMLYYAFVSGVALVIIFAPNILSGNLHYSMAIVTMGAFLFSSYLISAQIFIIKKGCSWCIVSALVCLAIFVLIFFA